MPGGRWFEGARLNYAEAVLAGAPEDRPALIAVAEQQPPREISRAELRGQVGALAAALRELGVGPGDRVAAYLPNIPEAVVALRPSLAAARCFRSGKGRSQPDGWAWPQLPTTRTDSRS